MPRLWISNRIARRTYGIKRILGGVGIVVWIGHRALVIELS